MAVWQGWQTTRVFRRFLAMSAAQAGSSGPGSASCVSLFADLVHEHLGRGVTQFTPPFQEPGDQLFAGMRNRYGDAVVELCVPVPCKGYHAEPCDQWLLAFAFDTGFKAGA